MYLNQNLIYESTNNQSNGQLNGQLNGNLNNNFNGNLSNGNHLNTQLNGNINTNLNHHLNNTQLNQLVQETTKQNNLHNQMIIGNAYSNYPFNLHDTIINDPTDMSTYYQQQFINNNQINSNLESNFQNHLQSSNYDLINSQTYSNQLARACPLTIQQRNANFLQTNLLNGHSLDALNTVGLSNKDVNLFKRPINMTNSLSNTLTRTNQNQQLKNGSMSFTRHLLVNSNGQTGSTGQLNNLIKNNNEYGNSEIDVRRLCLTEQQQLEFNLAQELEQKNKLNQQNLTNEIIHSTPKSNNGTLKKNKQNTLVRNSSESKVRNICAKLFGSSSNNNSNSSNNLTTTTNTTTATTATNTSFNQEIINNQNNQNNQNKLNSLKNVQTNNHITNGCLNIYTANNSQSTPPKASKLLASAVTNLNQQQTNKLNQKYENNQSKQCKSSLNNLSIDDQSKEYDPNVIYAEIRKKQTNNCEKINQIKKSDNGDINRENIKTSSSVNCNTLTAIKNSETVKTNNNTVTNNSTPSSLIDDKYVVIVDSSCVSNNSDVHNTSNQSLTVKNSPIKQQSIKLTSSNQQQSTGILTTDLDQQQYSQVNSQFLNNHQQQPQHNNQQLLNKQLLNQTNNNQQETCLKDQQSKQDKCDDNKIGLESPTTSSSESGRGTLNGNEQQLTNNNHHTHQNLRQIEENSNFDQASLTSDDMKRLKTFKEEVLENWNHNNKIIAANCIVEHHQRSNDNLNSSNNCKLIKNDDKNDTNTFEQVQLKIQKLLEDDALINDEEFDDLIASDAYQNYTAKALTINNCNLNNSNHLNGLSKLNRLSVVNESDGSWLSDSTHTNSNKTKLTKQLNQSTNSQQLNSSSNLGSNLITNLNASSNLNNSIQSNHQSIQSKDKQQTPDFNSLKRNSQTTNQTIKNQQQQQQPNLNKLDTSPHLEHQSPKTLKHQTNKNLKLNSRSINKLNGQQSTNKGAVSEDFVTLLNENSRRLNKLNKNQFKNRSMDDLTDLMDDLNSVYTEATMNYTTAAPTTVVKKMRGIESMYSEILTLLKNSRMDSVKTEIRPLKRNKLASQFGGSESSLNTDISRCYTKPLKPSYLRKNGIDDFNSRKMKRLENHVITLSKSVAQLTNEIRANQNLNLELHNLRKEVEGLKNRVQFNLMISDDLNNNKKTAATDTLPRKSTNNIQHINNLNGKHSLMSGFKKFFGDEQPQIRQFLKKLGYEKYASKFESEKIGINELIYLTEEKLQKLGLPMGPRIRIMQEIQLINN